METQQVLTQPSLETQSRRQSLRNFALYIGPALMVSIAYMDPGNYGTDLASGTAFRYDLIWALWMAGGMAMILQYLSGKLGIASEHSLAEHVKKSLHRNLYVVPYWLGAEAAAAATDLAEYLGTVIALNILFNIPLLYASIFGAFDVLIIMTMMNRKFRLIEQFFMLLVSVLAFGFLYQLIVIPSDPAQIAYHSVVPGPFVSTAILLVVGNIGATVMPHALYVHSWLTKNKMGIAGKKMTDAVNGNGGFSVETKRKTRRLHLWETVIFLTVAAVVNVGILLVAIPLPEFPGQILSVPLATQRLGILFGPIVPIVFALTLLSSGLTSSTLGTLAGQVIMEDLIGKHWNVWARRIITRFVNVFPTTLAILIGVDPIALLVYSQVILSLMLPLPMIPLVYYTSKKKIMGEFINRKSMMIASVVTVGLILAFNVYLIISIIRP